MKIKKFLRNNWYFIILAVSTLFFFGVIGLLGFIFMIFLIKGIKSWIKSEKGDWKRIKKGRGDSRENPCLLLW